MVQVIHLLDVTALDGELRAELRREWNSLRGASGDVVERRRIERQIQRMRSEEEKGRKRLGDAAIMLLDGTLDRDGYRLARERIEADLEGITAELKHLQRDVQTPSLPPLEEVLAKIGTWRIAVDSADIEVRRRMLAELVTQVHAHKIGYGKYSATITWTPLGEMLRQLAATLGDAA